MKKGPTIARRAFGEGGGHSRIPTCGPFRVGCLASRWVKALPHMSFVVNGGGGVELNSQGLLRDSHGFQDRLRRQSDGATINLFPRGFVSKPWVLA